jgi:hypothetical protein
MNRLLFTVVAVATLISGVAFGGQLTNVAARAALLPPTMLSQVFAAAGMDEASKNQIIDSGWDEDVVIERILTTRSFRLLSYLTVQEMSQLTYPHLTALKGPMIAARFPEIMQWGLAYPETDRVAFRVAIADILHTQNPASPILTEHQAKYWGTGTDIWSQADVQDILEMVYAPEWSMNASQFNWMRERIKNVALIAARKQIRAEGKSFVSYTVVSTNEDGKVSSTVVNPLVERMKPVIDAFNQPCWNDLGTALDGLGLENPALTCNLRTWTGYTELKASILSGDVLATDNPNWLPKLVFIMGVDDYNAFVSAYNGGSPVVSTPKKISKGRK